MGFGTVVGATILVSIAAYLLAQIDCVPIIGDWASHIATEIQAPAEKMGQARAGGGDSLFP